MMLTRPLTVVVDAGSAFLVVGALANLLPPIAAILAGLWYMVQIYESKTVQSRLYRHRIKRLAKKLRNLEARKLMLNAEIDSVEKVRAATAYAEERLEEAKSDAAHGMKFQD